MKGYELHQSIFGFLIPEFSLFMLKGPQTHLKQKTHQYYAVNLFRFKRKFIINVKHLQVL